MKRDFLMSLTRKTRIFVFLVLTLWIAVILQFAVERIFLKKGNISEAFSELHMKENIGNVTVTAVYDDSYLSEYDKKQLLYYIAEQIGLKVDVEPSVFYANNRCEVWYEKQAVRADSLLKIISTSEEGLDKHYVYVSLTIQEETAKSIAIYQERICTCLKELGAEDISVTLELSGKQVGEIPLGKKDQITDELLESLGAKCVYENRENEYYTVYAYTGLLKEYITVEKKKINVQVAIFYEKETDTTKIYLATPMLIS